MSKFKDEAYYEQLDKRTKEYKAWKEWASKKQEEEVSGVGDVVEKITEATGIKAAVKTFFGEDCGCDGRKEYLNKKLPFARGEVNEVTEEGYYFLKDIFSRPTRGNYTVDEMHHIVNIYNHVYNKREVASTCTTCKNTNILKAVNKLERYFNSTTDFINENYIGDE